jgi:hypothetical protein
VYSLLASFNVDEGLGVLEQAYQKTNDIIRKLKALKANIYRYYYDITKKQSKQDLQKLLEKLLVDYKQNFFDSAYYNLKTKDSLPRYKRAILNALHKINDQPVIMEKLALSVQELKRMDDYNDAFYYVEQRVRYIQDSFTSLEHLILAIDRKNEQYISAAASKILFLTNHSDDVEGIFNRLFKIVIAQQGFDFSQLFYLSQIRNVDGDSLYNQRRARIENIPEEIYFNPNLITDEMKMERVKSLLKNNIYGKKEIDQYVKMLLKGQKEMLASDIEVEHIEDYIKLILIFLYSKSVGMHYDVELMKQECKSNFITFTNFKIKGVSI